MSDEIIGFIVERIADLVADEVNLLSNAKNEFVSLQRELEMMQSFLIDADSKVEEGNQRLHTIVKQIREMAYEAEDLIDSFVQKDVDRKKKAKLNFLKKIISFCSCLAQTHQMGNEVAELKSRIMETTERLQRYQVLTNVEVIRGERPRSYPHSIGDENVVGFDKDVEILTQRLMNLDDQILAIVGMGGSGKTTMARKVYNHTKICDHFKCRAWVSVSQTWNKESLLKEILKQTTGQTGETLTVETIVQEIYKFLHEKSYLVVLDDVWEEDVLRKIMVPLTTSHGSKFLITARIRDVIRFHDLTYYVHEPRRLNPEESWELFRKIVFGHHSNTIMNHESKSALGKELLRKCDGLPLAVVSLAGLLRTKSTLSEWMKVKSNVSSKIIEDKVGPSEYGRVEDMLALSYSDLDHTLKSCFMYLGLFPEDVPISTRWLMQYWIAEGFFKSVQFSANYSMEDVAKQHLDELIQRCLVQVVHVNYAQVAKYVRVHDLMRDLAIKRAKEMCFSDTISSSSFANDWSSNVSGATLQPRRLSAIFNYLDDDIPEGDLLYNASPRLRSFVCWSYKNYWRLNLKNVVTNYPLLRVLILHCKLDVIPKEIGKLIHLRHLQISSSSLVNHFPDSIKNLRNLLSFEHKGDILRGHSINVKQMEQLRYLRISEFIGHKPLNLHYLRNLRVLKYIRAGPWMMTELKLLSPTLQNLAILEIQNSN